MNKNKYWPLMLWLKDGTDQRAIYVVSTARRVWHQAHPLKLGYDTYEEALTKGLRRINGDIYTANGVMPVFRCFVACSPTQPDLETIKLIVTRHAVNPNDGEDGIIALFEGYTQEKF